MYEEVSNEKQTSYKCNRGQIRRSLASPITTDDVLDPRKELFDVLASVGLDTRPAGGRSRFPGKVSSVDDAWLLATMAGIGLMAKAVAVADLWRYPTGKGQDLTRSALHQKLHIRTMPVL